MGTRTQNIHPFPCRYHHLPPKIYLITTIFNWTKPTTKIHDVRRKLEITLGGARGKIVGRGMVSNEGRARAREMTGHTTRGKVWLKRLVPKW